MLTHIEHNPNYRWVAEEEGRWGHLLSQHEPDTLLRLES